MGLLSMQDLDLLQDQFSGVSVPTYISPASKIHFILIIFNIVQLFLSWLSSGTFSFWDIFRPFLQSPFF
jgi:hypothetical protein